MKDFLRRKWAHRCNEKAGFSKFDSNATPTIRVSIGLFIREPGTAVGAKLGLANTTYAYLYIGQIRQRTRCKPLWQSDNPKACISRVKSILELTFRIDGATGTNDLYGSRFLELFAKVVVLLLHLGNASTF
jgi:hypothetical protein